MSDISNTPSALCVYCGGDGHPAECGHPEYEGRFWFGYLLATVFAAWLIWGLFGGF